MMPLAFAAGVITFGPDSRRTVMTPSSQMHLHYAQYARPQLHDAGAAVGAAGMAGFFDFGAIEELDDGLASLASGSRFSRGRAN